MTTKPKTKPISEAPKIRIPEDLLKKLDAEAKHFAKGAKMSRIQMVSYVIEDWLREKASVDVQPLRTFSTPPQPTIFTATNVAEFDRTIGGGLVAGSTILLSGWRGVGVTTLMAAVAHGFAGTDRPSLYVSTEQSANDLIAQAHRVGANNSLVDVMANPIGIDIECVLDRADRLHSVLIVFESLQSLTSGRANGEKGSASQAKKVMETIVNYCRQKNISAIVTNRLTSRGEPKGGVELEQLANTVLVFSYPREDDKDAPKEQDTRVLCVEKNRHGSDTLKSYWKLTATGMQAVVKNAD